MSEDEVTQTVVTTEAPAVQGAEVAVDARNDGDDLDKLLSEFDQHDKSRPAASSTEPGPGPEPDLKALASKVENIDGFMREQNVQTFKRDMKQTVNDVRGDFDANIFDDQIVQAWIDVQAQNDPRLSQAWVNRHADPKKFEAVKAALGKNFAKKFSQMPDRQVSEDRATVAAAVRGASTRAPEAKAPNFAALSPQDFQAEKDKLFGNS